MEDSGYFSHRASEFKYSSGGGASGRENSAAGRRIPSPDDLFKLSFDDLLSSRRYSYFRYGFADEGDFEDFKRELLDFRRLKRQARGESPPREESSPDELDATTIGNRNRGSGGGGGGGGGVGGDSDGEFSGSIKVSDTTVRVSVVEERGDADGDEDAGGGGGGSGEGRRETGWGNGGRPGRRGSSPDGEDDTTTTTTTTTTTNPPRYTPQVKRSVSLRSYGGAGARARGRCESNKRNGVYFDEDCFLDDSSPPRSADAVQARANEAREAEDRGGREERERGAPGAGTSPPVDDALLFSVPPERRPARDGARRVSFRETPETFLYKEEPSLPRQTLVAPKHEPSSPRGSFVAARNGANVPVSVSDVTKAPTTYNCASGTRSPRDSLASSNEPSFPRESVRVTSSGEPRTRTRSCDSVDEPRSPRESFAFSDEPRSRTKTCVSQNEPRSPRDSFAFSDEPRSPRESFAFSDEPRSPRESFAFSDEPRSPRDSFAFSDEPRSPRESFAFSDEPRSPRDSSDEARTRTKSCVSKDEPRSPRDSLAFSDEASLPGRCGDPLNLPPNRDGETRQRPPPIAIPIKLVNFPVSRQSSSLQSSADGRERRLETDVTAVGEGLVETGPTSSGISRTAASSLPPRVPVTIPIRVEKPTERPAAAARPARNDDAGGEGQGESDSGSGSAPSGNGRSARSRDCAAENGSRLGDRDWNREGVEQGQGSRSYNPSKRSSLLENLKRLSCHGRPRSGRGIDPFMEFFSGDEHFLEFERVFETVNNHRFSRDMDLRRQGSWHRDQQPQGGAERNPFRGDDGDDVEDDDDDLGVLHIDETFLDFFDNDEDFMEFERELEKIKSSRRSRLLENLHRRSSCDIFSDVMSFCDRSLKRSGSGSSTPSASPKAERRLSAAKNVESELWNSAEEWGMVMNKLKRNSRLFSDQAAGGRTVADDSFSSIPSFSSSSSSSATPAVLRRSSSSSSSTTSSSTPSSGRAAVVAGHSEQCPCLRDCQYTCHLQCVPSVTLDCTTVSPGSGQGPVATPTDLPSPSASAETSLTERRTIVTRSPQKQQQPQPASAAYSELSVQAAPQSVQHLGPPGGACGSSSPSQNVLLPSASARDPLLGACESQAVAQSSSNMLSSAAPSLSLCAERDLNQNAKNVDGDSLVPGRVGEDVCDASNEKDETDSGYRSGTIPDEKLPKAPSQATLNRKERRRKIQTFNHFVPKASLEEVGDGESFQGFLRVTLNLIRPITMELGARPPSIYELLTREHIVEQSTQHIAFYMPRDTVKSIHITSKTTTKEVITGLLKKFHILDHPRKFALYEQEFNEKNKLVKLRRLTDKDFPLVAMLSWEPERIKHYRLVLQENETGEIVWEAFSTPELKNFMIVLDREENEAIAQLQYKYRIMKRIIHQRMKELRKERQAQSESTA